MEYESLLDDESHLPSARPRKERWVKYTILFFCAIISFGVIFSVNQNVSRILPKDDDRHDDDDDDVARLSSLDCTVEWFEQPLDHFNYQHNVTFLQRILVYDKFWNPNNGTIFFYTGNEGDVTLYANNTGLMWEHARAFSALIIFAEHRYYGQTYPMARGGGGSLGHDSQEFQYLTAEQALADFARFLYTFKARHDVPASPVIAFGGSYGGMLSAWFRTKYPSLVTGAIAASAPILAFPTVTGTSGTLTFVKPWVKSANYWAIVTRDASPAAGASVACIPNVRHSWRVIQRLSSTPEGRETLERVFRLCGPLEEAETQWLMEYLAVAWDTMAMGNYPYPSSYLTGLAHVEMPAMPVQVACSFLSNTSFFDDVDLLEAVHAATSVFYNASKDLACTTLPTALVDFDGIWDYQWCTEMLPQETYFDMNGESDMFWKKNSSMADVRSRCRDVWGVEPRPLEVPVNYGGQDFWLHEASNIVFSNGQLDPWSSGGLQGEFKNQSSNIVLVNIEAGAHHLDLFHSHPLDPPSVTRARAIEIEHIQLWLEQDKLTSTQDR